ncbi:MAG: hypothetical protein AW07_02178 [Candidatus Accumulibacter sp. SK-11]|nr:MAG: hypothetical protein AW07_02178 [Candidatus Accumulibacter sp. SK-11]
MLHRHGARRRQLGVTREGGTSEADDTSVAQQFAHAFGCQTAVVDRPALDPLVTPIRLDDHAERRQTGRMRRDMRFYGQHAAGCRRMHRGRHPAIGAADQLPLANLLADLDQRIRRPADALMQRHEQACGKRRLGDRLLHRDRLVRLGFDSPPEAEQLRQHRACLRRRA